MLALCEPTAKGNEHELTTLKRQIPEDLRCGAAKGRHTLLAYDRAIVDFIYAYTLKQSTSIHVVTRWKDSFAPMTTMARPVDRAHPANALVISDETVLFNNTPGAWRKITVKAADSDEIHVLLTNELNFPPRRAQ